MGIASRPDSSRCQHALPGVRIARRGRRAPPACSSRSQTTSISDLPWDRSFWRFHSAPAAQRWKWMAQFSVNVWPVELRPSSDDGCILATTSGWARRSMRMVVRFHFLSIDAGRRRPCLDAPPPQRSAMLSSRMLTGMCRRIRTKTSRLPAAILPSHAASFRCCSCDHSGVRTRAFWYLSKLSANHTYSASSSACALGSASRFMSAATTFSSSRRSCTLDFATSYAMTSSTTVNPASVICFSGILARRSAFDISSSSAASVAVVRLACSGITTRSRIFCRSSCRVVGADLDMNADDAVAHVHWFWFFECANLLLLKNPRNLPAVGLAVCISAIGSYCASVGWPLSWL
mmetsp:Transcript_28504/g.80303  ORF Transcript_28504/g.80303 Transcript_28504/m.80303 type:complete len:347 (+) Transcript_28504:74-1114(+)